jgi:hypothetical protein
VLTGAMVTSGTGVAAGQAVVGENLAPGEFPFETITAGMTVAVKAPSHSRVSHRRAAERARRYGQS